MKRSLRSIISLFSILLISLALTSMIFAQQAGDVKSDEGTKVTKIGILMPNVKLVEATGDISPEEALRNTYAVLLQSDTFEIVGIGAKLKSLALEEAVKKGCDYIINVSLLQEKKKKGGGLFGKIARDTGRRATWETARKVPYGGGTGERIARTAAQSAIINTGYTMSNMSVKVRKNDRFTLDYSVSSTKGETLFENSLKEKATKKNKDELLMTMIEKSAEDIVSVLRKRPGRTKVTP